MNTKDDAKAGGLTVRLPDDMSLQIVGSDQSQYVIKDQMARLLENQVIEVDGTKLRVSEADWNLLQVAGVMEG